MPKIHQYKMEVPKNIQKYFNKKEIKITSEIPLRESEGDNVYLARVATVKSAIVQAVYELTEGYKLDELYTYRENEAIKNLEKIHVVPHMGVLVAELHSSQLDWVSEIVVKSEYQGSNYQKGKFIG